MKHPVIPVFTTPKATYTCDGMDSGRYAVHYDPARDEMVCQLCDWLDPDYHPGKRYVQRPVFQGVEPEDVVIMTPLHMVYCPTGRHLHGIPAPNGERHADQDCPAHAARAA
jgi:hypothetical protein